MGRPLTDNSELVGFRIAPMLLEQVDALADASKVTRSEMLRVLVEAGLDARLGD